METAIWSCERGGRLFWGRSQDCLMDRNCNRCYQVVSKMRASSRIVRRIPVHDHRVENGFQDIAGVVFFVPSRPPRCVALPPPSEVDSKLRTLGVQAIWLILCGRVHIFVVVDLPSIQSIPSILAMPSS